MTAVATASPPAPPARHNNGRKYLLPTTTTASHNNNSSSSSGRAVTSRLTTTTTLSRKFGWRGNRWMILLFGGIVLMEVILVIRSQKWTTFLYNNNNNDDSETIMELSLSLWKSSAVQKISYRSQLHLCRTQDYNTTSREEQPQQQQQPCTWELCTSVPLFANATTTSTMDWSDRRTVIDYFCHHHRNNYNNLQQQQQRFSTKTSASVQYRFHNPLNDVTRYVCHRTLAVPGNGTVMVSSSDCDLPSSSSSSTSFATTATTTTGTTTYHYGSDIFPVPPIELSSTIMQQQHIQQLAIQQPPIELRFNDDTSLELIPFADCDIPCRHDSGGAGTLGYRLVRSTPYDNYDTNKWTIVFSMEGPQYYQQLYIEPSKWKDNYFYSTTSYMSEVPLPYYSRAEYNIYHTNFVPYETGIHGAVFLARNCNSLNNREQLIQDIMSSSTRNTSSSSSSSSSSSQSVFRVDAVSTCLNNAGPPNGVSLDDKVAVMKQYLFYLAFENQCETDYITEKLWGPMEAGTIPIYYGSPNVKDHVPFNSIIHVDDYNTTEELVNHLIEVSNNRTLYESYHAWRFQPEPDHFLTRYDITDTHSTCRTCRWAYARMHGIGWNHTTQSLRPLENIGSRQVCLSSDTKTSSTVFHHHRQLLVHHPFIEEWVNAKGDVVSVEPVLLRMGVEDEDATSRQNSNNKNNDPNTAFCQYPLNGTNHVVDIHDGKYRRFVYNHDGVIDFTIIQTTTTNTTTTSSNSMDTNIVLQLQMSILLAPIVFRPVRDGVWHLQDAATRYTVVAVSEYPTTTTMNHLVVAQSNTHENVLRIEMISSQNHHDNNSTSSVPMMIQKLRIIVEDVDTFHFGADQEETYFGTLLTNDFVHPMERYVYIPKPYISGASADTSTSTTKKGR